MRISSTSTSSAITEAAFVPSRVMMISDAAAKPTAVLPATANHAARV
jgi:hypothetical protein